MYCQNCGKEIDDKAVVCVHCGVETTPLYPAQNVSYQQDDAPLGCLLSGVCFIMPLIGLILFLVWKKDTPTRAKAALKMAIIGFVVNIVIYILYGVLVASAMSSAYYY